MNQLVNVAKERAADAAAAQPVGHPPPPETILRARRGWQVLNLGELWHARDLIYFLAWRDVKVRYKQTVLGAAWAVLQPALMMVVFTIFFSRLAEVSSGGLPYPLFVYAGLLPWSFFATAVANGGNSVIGSERLITKIYFPRLAIPFASVAAALVDLLVASGLLLVLMLCYGIFPGPEILLLPVVFVLLLLAGLGVGTLLAALNVAYRDFRYVIPFMIQVWMFATPSIYLDLFHSPDPDAHSGLVRTLLTLNPMTGLIATFRAATLGTAVPWAMLAFSASSVALLFFLGCLYYRKVEDSFADII
jgi:lipopolysaccharide transport system permease protein